MLSIASRIVPPDCISKVVWVTLNVRNVAVGHPATSRARRKWLPNVCGGRIMLLFPWNT